MWEEHNCIKGSRVSCDFSADFSTTMAGQSRIVEVLWSLSTHPASEQRLLATIAD